MRFLNAVLVGGTEVLVDWYPRDTAPSVMVWSFRSGDVIVEAGDC